MISIFLSIMVLAGPGEPLTKAPPSVEPYLVGISVSKADESASWYEKVLGFKEYKRMELPQHGLRIVFLERGSFHLELIQKEGSAPIGKLVPGIKDETLVQGFKKCAFLVPDIGPVVRALKAQGVRFVVEPFDDKELHLKSFLVADPDGNVIQFMQELK